MHSGWRINSVRLISTMFCLERFLKLLNTINYAPPEELVLTLLFLRRNTDAGCAASESAILGL